MKILHRISFNNDEKAARMASEILGREIGPGLQTVVVDENMRGAQEFIKYTVECDLLDIVTTEFTKSEIANSNHVVIRSKWIKGYPQPFDDSGYYLQTYGREASERCPEIGRQIGPFRIESVPKWGKRSVFQMHTIHDEFFVHAETYEKVFEPFGVGAREVLIHTSGAVANSVVQLEIPIFETHFLTEFMVVNECPERGYKRFLSPQIRGYWPRLSVLPDVPFFKTHEVFGEGWEHYSIVVVRQDLYRAIAEFKLTEITAQCIQNY